jgi:hypothetical protein
MRTIVLILLATAVAAQPKPDAQLNEVMARVGAYVDAYGEKTSAVVGKETYTQNVTIEGAAPLRPRRLVAEFAIVRADRGWTGFRDVAEVNGEPVRERRDRLVSLLTSQSATMSEAMRIANESARYNVGPVARNFNTPTTAMFFFLPEHLSRFTFTRKGNKKIGNVQALEIGFKETTSPTFIMTRAGKDVPVEGTLWVDPANGTVLRTRMRMKNFADTEATPDVPAGAQPQQRAAVNPNTPTGGREALAASGGVMDMTLRELESSADFDVTYERQAGLDLWLPVEMVEFYEGPIFTRNRPVMGRATNRANYSDFKQFATGIKIVPQ